MSDNIEISPYGNMLMFKKGYTIDFIKNMIEKYNLSGLRIFDHLDRLESIDFLRDMNFLNKLHISCILDQDYSFLSELTNLEDLLIGLSVTEKNLIKLDNLLNLKILTIQWRKGKIKGLEKCQNLESIHFEDYKESDLITISSLKNLKSLRVDNASIKSLHGLENSDNLEVLNLGLCKSLKSINAINGLKNLKKIHLDACSKIEDYDSLDNLPSLEYLELINCKGIKSIKFIKNFPKLRVLELIAKTEVLDSDLTPALGVEHVFYHHFKHYNIRIESKGKRAEV